MASNDADCQSCEKTQKEKEVDFIVENYSIPERMVGKIIGHKGEQIARLQNETGCRIHLISDSSRKCKGSCTLSGSQKSIQTAKLMIEEIISKASNPCPFSSDGDGPAKVYDSENKTNVGLVEKNISFKKYPIGSSTDKELVFNFPYLMHKPTVAYINNNARVMFIIRGPPGTGKATLSEMITDAYSGATYCCADHYFTATFANVTRTRESLKASHAYCQKKVESACLSNVQLIIVQNTHMRKWEMQPYLDFAAIYDYTVIMAITLYRFDCTPEALAVNNTDGLDINYFQRRLKQWEDVLPLFTGWFVASNDALHILYHTKKSLDTLLSDGKFCRVFNIFNTEEFDNYFKPKKLLYCLAGYIKDQYLMRDYYLSDEVQALYGRCFTLSIMGYLVSPTVIMAIVNVNEEMRPIFLQQNTSSREFHSASDIGMNTLHLHGNIQEYSKTIAFPKEDDLTDNNTVILEDWDKGEEINIATCSFMYMADKKEATLDIETMQGMFQNYMALITDDDGFLKYDEYVKLEEEENQIFRLPNDMWLIKPSKKMSFTTVFTGLYI